MVPKLRIAGQQLNSKEGGVRGVTGEGCSACLCPRAEDGGGLDLQTVRSAPENREASTRGVPVLAPRWDVVLDPSSWGLLAPPAG